MGERVLVSCLARMLELWPSALDSASMAGLSGTTDAPRERLANGENGCTTLLPRLGLRLPALSDSSASRLVSDSLA
jgi:hypothetical protein